MRKLQFGVDASIGFSCDARRSTLQKRCKVCRFHFSWCFFLFVGLSSRRLFMQTMRLVLRNTIANACACFVLCFAIGKRDCAFRIVFYDSKRMCFFYFRKCHFFDSCDSKYCGKYFFCLQKRKTQKYKTKSMNLLAPEFQSTIKNKQNKKITASPPS